MRTTRIDRPLHVFDMTGSKAPMHEPRDIPPMTEAELDDCDRLFRESAEEAGRKLVAAMKREGMTATAIVPDYGPALDWMKELVTPILTAPRDAVFELECAEPLSARSIVLHLALPDGSGLDCVTVRLESSVSLTRYSHGDRYSEYLHRVELTVRDGSRLYQGRADHECCEMTAWAVGLRGAPQEVLERTVAALSRPDTADWPASLYAALAPRERCHACNRPLTDAISKAVGLGPDCASRLGLEHSQRMADAVLSRRAAR